MRATWSETYITRPMCNPQTTDGGRAHASRPTHAPRHRSAQGRTRRLETQISTLHLNPEMSFWERMAKVEWLETIKAVHEHEQLRHATQKHAVSKLEVHLRKRKRLVDALTFHRVVSCTVVSRSSRTICGRLSWRRGHPRGDRSPQDRTRSLERRALDDMQLSPTRKMSYWERMAKLERLKTLRALHDNHDLHEATADHAAFIIAEMEKILWKKPRLAEDALWTFGSLALPTVADRRVRCNGEWTYMGPNVVFLRHPI
ncbi:Aste57867_3410 [Aphanomyces stellatus]|uniref:Aste57867_3410 protein n=1 Tax=Aphanomyces stellatus TaxID=120398 RepID=A0A485KC15_9STRA|nr:hypothetical protein As57867_003400 [Aphanomyces stellatus]VFT80576.1 Aste57867_3410 [Aphanomyces stellatus]